MKGASIDTTQTTPLFSFYTTFKRDSIIKICLLLTFPSNSFNQPNQPWRRFANFTQFRKFAGENGFFVFTGVNDTGEKAKPQ
jgi:hypothetical protein